MDISDAFAQILAESCCVNSDANLSKNENGTVDHIGSKTGVGFCRWLRICELQARVECPFRAFCVC